MPTIGKLIDTAAGREKAELVLKNCKIVDVFTNEIVESSLAIKDGIIIGYGDYEGEKYIDMEGSYVSPSFIDGHVHIESSMVSPAEFTKTILPRGTTAIIADPHEIANVAGLDGIEYMLNSTKNLPMDVYLMLPSCVPATPYETSGAVLKASNLAEYINNDRILGLGELMDFVGTINSNEDILKKLNLAGEKVVDGHGPGLVNEDLNAYVIAGVKTEHECSTPEEMKDRISRGMYVQLREGTAARNLEALLGEVTKDNMRRCLFCTDDKHPEDLIENGNIDNNIRKAIRLGLDPIDAIKMASLNTAECYGLGKTGAIAPGYAADLVVFDDLKNIEIKKVFKNGKLVAEDGEIKVDVEETIDNKVMAKVNIKEFTEDMMELKLSSDLVNVIKINPGNLVTDRVERKVDVIDGSFVYNSNKDVQKIVVVERHTGKSTTMVALVEGYGIQNGAIGTTIAHDSHNIIVIGDNDKDIVNCINEIRILQGGIVISSGGKVVGEIELKIAGIMSLDPITKVNSELVKMMKIARELGVKDGVDPFMTLSFMALPVIPDIKITDQGLFDVSKFEFIEIEVQ